MGAIFIATTVAMLLGGGGLFGYDRYGGSRTAGALGLALSILLVVWIVEGLHRTSV